MRIIPYERAPNKGEEIAIRAVLVSDEDPYLVRVQCSHRYYAGDEAVLSINLQEILGIVAEPLRVGDHVYSKRLSPEGAKIVAIHQGEAWLLTLEDGAHWTLPLADLSRERDSQ